MNSIFKTFPVKTILNCYCVNYFIVYWFRPVDIDQHVGSSLEGVDPISAGVDSGVVAVVCGGEVAAAAVVLL